MFKCLECGCVFEEGEQKVWLESVGEYAGEGVYRAESGCPECNGSFEKTVKCSCCGEEFFGKDIESGFCKKCLEEQATASVVKKYLYENDLIVEFLTAYIWSIEAPEVVTADFKTDCIDIFERKMLNDKILNRSDFLNLCKGFVFEDSSHFAEWLAKRG